MEWTQIVLAVSITLITGTLVYIGISIVTLIKELRVTLFKTNQILDDTHTITESVAGPVSSVSEFVMGFKNGMAVFNSIFPNKSTKSKLSVKD